jgi:hypothetical protein
MRISNVSAYKPELRDISDQEDTGGIKLNGIKTRDGKLQQFGVINVVSPSDTALAFDFVYPFDNGPDDYENDDVCNYLAEVPEITVTYYDFDCGGSMPNLLDCSRDDQTSKRGETLVCDVCESISVWGGGQHHRHLYDNLTVDEIQLLKEDELARFPEVANTSFAFTRSALLGTFFSFQVTNTTQLDLSIDETSPKRAAWANNSKLVLVEKETPLPAFLDEDEDTSRTTHDQTPTTVYMNKYQIQPIDPRVPVGFLKATATHRGTGRDNPLTTDRLSKLQLDRSITIVFKNTEKMSIVQEVLRMPHATNLENDGRNFLFSFVDPARQICDAWRQPPSPPNFPPGTAVTYQIEQKYYLKDDCWTNGYAGWEAGDIKALENEFEQGMTNAAARTNVTSVTALPPVDESGPLVIRFHTAELTEGGVTLDAYFNRLIQVNRASLQQPPPDEGETPPDEGETEGGFCLVANGLPSYEVLQSVSG